MDNFINVGGPAGTATPADVLSGKTFTNSEGEQTGTMTDRGAWRTTAQPGAIVAVPEGYHNGSGGVTCERVGLTISSAMVAKRNGGSDSNKLVTPTQSISSASAYCIVCGKIAAYNVSATLKGYINGSWETIKTISGTNSCTDAGGNGGQAVQFGYYAGLITKSYTSYKLEVTGTSVHPDFAVAYLFKA